MGNWTNVLLFPHVVFGKSSRLGVYLYHTSLFTNVFVSSNFWGVTHDASRECVWLRNVIQHIRGSCGIILDKELPTVLYEDNATCIAQLKEGYTKRGRTKRILPNFPFTRDLQKSSDINVQQVRSCENLADLVTKSLPNLTFQRPVHDIGMR